MIISTENNACKSSDWKKDDSEEISTAHDCTPIKDNSSPVNNVQCDSSSDSDNLIIEKNESCEKTENSQFCNVEKEIESNDICKQNYPESNSVQMKEKDIIDDSDDDDSSSDIDNLIIKKTKSCEKTKNSQFCNVEKEIEGDDMCKQNYPESKSVQMKEKDIIDDSYDGSSDIDNLMIEKTELCEKTENSQFCNVEKEIEGNDICKQNYPESNSAQMKEKTTEKAIIDDSDDDDDDDVIVKRNYSNALLSSDEEETMVKASTIRSSEILENSDEIQNRNEDIPKELLLKNNDLFDAEEDEDSNTSEQPTETKSDKNVLSNETIPITKPKTLKSQRFLKEEKQKIYSETQRMTRESRVTLPHHKPKQMTLSDFLNRKKNVPPTIKIKVGKLNTSAVSSTTNDIPSPATDSPSLFFEDSPHPLALSSSVKEVEECNSEFPVLQLQDSETMDVLSQSTTISEESKTQSQTSDQNNSECAPSTSGSCNDSFKALKSDILKNMKSFTPKLSANPNTVIDLDGDDFVEKPSGINELMHRFVRHSTKRKPKDEKKLSLSIVQKETDENGEVTLKQSQVTITAPAEEYVDLSQRTPGSKLLCLKEALQAKMSVKKKESLQKRLKLHALDNEEFEEEEEEAEMTESEGEDEDGIEKEEVEDDIDKEVVADVDNESCDEDMNKDIRKELFDEEAEESEEEMANEKDEDEISDQEEENAEDELINKSPIPTQDTVILDSDEDSQDIVFNKKKRKSAVIEDDESENEEDATNSQINEPILDKSLSSISLPGGVKDDNDMNGSLIATNSGYESDRATDTSFDFQSSMLPPYQIPRSGANSTASSLNTQQSTDLLPAEDSQSFFRSESYAAVSRPSNSFQFYSENSSDTRDSTCRRSLEDSQSATSDFMKENSNFCSGKFTDKESHSNFNTSQPTKTQNWDHVLDLCSGTFTNRETGVLAEQDDPLELISSNAAPAEQEDSNDLQLSFVNENDESEEEEEEEINEETGKIGRAHFLENEAELSGSEAESDEDLDIDEEDDILDEEMGDQDALPSEDELRDQVGRVHFKTMLDQDKKELRLIQERYLEDGDLHGDGATRARSFRWQNGGNENDDDDRIFNNSDGEMDEQEDEAETQWRKQRIEREKWMLEKKINSPLDDNEDFGHEIKRSKEFENENQDENSIYPVERHLTSSESFSDSFSLNKSARKGSFLSRERKSLDKIAQFSEKGTKANLIGANQSSKNFVFSSLSQTNSATNQNVAKVTAKSVSNGTTLKKAKVVANPPITKPPISKPQVKRSSSLFSYL